MLTAIITAGLTAITLTTIVAIYDRIEAKCRK